MNLKRIRWAVRGVLFLGVAASTVANILHARDNPISQAIAAWPPLALLITIEVITRVPILRRGLTVARILAAALIAGIAAWVSYWHMAGVASRYGEQGASPYLLPLSVDGLIVVASICLVELAGRIRAAGEENGESNGREDARADQANRSRVHREQAAREPDPPAGPEEVAAVEGVKLTPSRKAHPTAKERVEKAHRRTPAATPDELAKRLNLSTKTVRRYRPRTAEVAQLNGHQPDAMVAAGDVT